MAQDYAASVQGVCIRATRLLATGAPASGATASYVMSAFIRASFTPEYEEGEEITEKTASGGLCVSYKAPDTLRRVTLELAICEPDVELTELLSGGLILASGGSNVGYAAPVSGTDPNQNGCSLEVWSHAVQTNRRAAVNPFFRWVFPKVSLRPTGDRTIENGLLANVFSGTGEGNATWGTGPVGDWPFVSDRAYAYSRVATAPTGVRGYVTV